MKLLLATRNRHKLLEIKAILAAPGLTFLGASETTGLPEVSEDGNSFQANAVKKAVTLALASGLWTLADDSGLEVEALAGEPGVKSARFAGEPPDYEANNRLLLSKLKGMTSRAAAFRCVIALSSPHGRAQVVEGSCEGRIIQEPRGTNGFGYDPIFVPAGHALTFAEMPASSKNAISHRAAALRRALECWQEAFASDSDEWPARRRLIPRPRHNA